MNRLQRIFRRFGILIFLWGPIYAQYVDYSNLIIGVEGDEQIIVYLDGAQINDAPQSQVAMYELTPGNRHVKVKIFPPRGKPEYIIRTVYLEEGMQVTMLVKKNRRGQYVLRLSDPGTPIPPPEPPYPPFPPMDVPPPIPPMDVPPPATQNQGTGGNQQNQTQTNQQNTNIVINIGGVYGGNVQGGGSGQGSGNQPPRNDPGPGWLPPSPVPGYNGPIGCPNPMNEYAFQQALETIKKQYLEDTKLEVAKQIASSNCLLARQVKEILQLFVMETHKLEFAKFAYHYTCDLGNYFIVNDAFVDPRMVDELTQYVQSKTPRGTNLPPNTQQTPSPVPGYNGPVGCYRPMDEMAFQKAKETIKSKAFEDSKLTIAKQIASNNCLLARQVKEIMQLFSYETTRLEFAKFAYRYTYDIGNYYLVNDAFQYESSIEELNRFLGNR